MRKIQKLPVVFKFFATFMKRIVKHKLMFKLFYKSLTQKNLKILNCSIFFGRNSFQKEFVMVFLYLKQGNGTIKIRSFKLFGMPSNHIFSLLHQRRSIAILSLSNLNLNLRRLKNFLGVLFTKYKKFLLFNSKNISKEYILKIKVAY